MRHWINEFDREDKPIVIGALLLIAAYVIFWAVVFGVALWAVVRLVLHFT